MESLRLRLLLDAALVCMLQRLKKEHERVVSLESTDGSGGAFMPQPQGQRE